MATKRKRLNLSKKSFHDYADEIRKYRDDIEQKTDLFVFRLTEIGYNVIKSTLSEHVDSGSTIGSVSIKFDQEAGRYQWIISADSDALLFLEFGSGLKGQGSAQNPKAGEMGMGPGTFSPAGHWDDPNGWWYQKGSKDSWRSKKNEDGTYNSDVKWHHTFGHEASMPFYKAEVEMKKEIEAIAKEIFGG